MSYFIRNGNTYRVASEESMDLHKALPVGNYTIKQDPMSGILFLEMVDSFVHPTKLYGDTTKNCERIIRTFNDRSTSTGVMLTGEKGSGKSLLAKIISIEAAAKWGIPTIIINQPYVGDAFNKFMQDIEQPCIVLFDEFEKVYDNEDQEKALTLLDGVFPSKKLFVLTCNDKWRVNEHMRNRPGRIFYMLDFTGLDHNFIVEYCKENLKAPEHIEKICSIAALFEQFNFDMLKALVEEMNRYGETPQDAMKMLNTKPEFNNKGSFDVQLKVGDKIIPELHLTTKVWVGNPLNGYVHIDYERHDADGDFDYVEVTFSPNDLKQVVAQEGKFSFVSDDCHLVLTRKKEQSYNYFAF
jgi:hypothetical protein